MPEVHYIALHCIALRCIALHCIALHCIALYCIILYHIRFYYMILYCIILYRIILYCIVLFCSILYHTIWTTCWRCFRWTPSGTRLRSPRAENGDLTFSFSFLFLLFSLISFFRVVFVSVGFEEDTCFTRSWGRLSATRFKEQIRNGRTTFVPQPHSANSHLMAF